MRLLWANNAFRLAGGYGYSIHALKMKQALEHAGVKITIDPNMPFDLAVHIAPCLENLAVLDPETREFASYKPIPGKRNLLFTMAELSDVQFWPDYITSGTTMVVTASRHSRDVLAKHYAGAIEVCPEGIDPELFTYCERHYDVDSVFPKKFRFLWVNSTSDEKGIKVLLSAWHQWKLSGRMPAHVELYIKESGEPGGMIHNVPQFYQTTADSRNLPVKELVALYHSAHAFIQCSHGEAWGLSCGEAAATGLPVIFTGWGGTLDFLDSSVAFPVERYSMSPFGSKSRPGEIAAWGARADEGAIIERMEEVYWGYPFALTVGRAASDRMRSRFSWAQAATRFVEICERALELPILPTEPREVSAAAVEATSALR